MTTGLAAPAMTVGAAPARPLAPLARLIADTIQDTLPSLPVDQQALLVVQLVLNLTEESP